MEFSHGGHGKDLLEDMEWVHGGSRNVQFTDRSCRKVRRSLPHHRQSGFDEQKTLHQGSGVAEAGVSSAVNTNNHRRGKGETRGQQGTRVKG